MSCNTAIYGPYSQTLFLGATISSFSSRIGWNSDESSLDVTLVEDPCEADKVYYGCDTTAQTHTGSDAFTPPILGSPVYFKFGDFEYSGILRNWKEKSGSTKTYVAQASGPNIILDAVKVVIGGYSGDVLSVPNVINAYGYLEEVYGTVCPTDTSLYSLLGYYPALGFGGANRTDAGISWNQLRNALILLINSSVIDPGIGGFVYSPLLSGKFGTQPTFRGYNYYIDLTELPATVDDLRIQGDVTSLLDIITQVCDYAGLDWYATLEYIPDWDGSCTPTSNHYGHIDDSVGKFIKIYTSDRSSQPSSADNVDSGTGLDIDSRLALGTITSFINENGKESADRGVELRPEVTNAMVVGDLRQDLWQMTSSATGVGTQDTYTANIWPYWGEDPSGYPIISYGYNDEHYFGINIDDIWDEFLGQNKPEELSSIYQVTLGELSAILDQGGKSTWENYVHEKKPGFASGLYMCPDGHVYNIVGAKGALISVKTDNVKATSRFLAERATTRSLDPDVFLADRLFYKLEGYAQNFFGKKFLVQPPIMCTHASESTPYSYDTNWVPSDGAWTESSILDLSTGTGSGNTFRSTDAVEMFRQPDGRVECICKFENTDKRIDMTNWQPDDYYQPWASGCYTRATCEKIVFLDPINRLHPRAVVSIDQPVISNKVYIDNQEWGFTAKTATLGSMFPDAGDMATRKAFAKNMAKTPGSDTINWGQYPTPLLPTHVAVPLKSTTLRYGPWYGASFSESSVTEMVIEPDLNPWTYGSFINMGIAGQLVATNKILNQTVSELGSITVAGSPQYSLGDLLVAGGPEVTNIDVGVGPGGITTTYQLRTFTPDYNSFSKTRLDNLKKRAENIRYIQRLDRLARINEARTKNTKGGLATVLTRDDRYTRASSHSFILSSVFNDYDPAPGLTNADVSGVDDIVATDRVINTVVNTDLRKALPEFNAGSGDGWLYRAGMETQGLFRSYTTKSGEICKMAEYPTGVRYGFSEDDNYSDLAYRWANNSTYAFRGPVYNEALPPIMCGTLNPFTQSPTNPNDSQSINFEDPYSSGKLVFTIGSGYGHDIEYVVRDGIYPLDLSVKYPEENYSESNWYRPIGIKGPPVIVGWGFDVAGKPVPNKDEVAGSGGRSPQFADDWLSRSDLWKAGPLDIRWDYRRGVWTGAPSYKIVRVKLTETTTLNNIISAEILGDNTTAFDYQGSGITNKYIALQNSVANAVISGAYGYAVYDPTLQDPSGNYAQYHLISYQEPVFAIRTIGPGQPVDNSYEGASGTVVSMNPSYYSDGLGDDFGTVFVKGGAAGSGYLYSCRYYQYNVGSSRHEFIPEHGSLIQEPIFLNGDDATMLRNGNQVVKTDNFLNFPNVTGIMTWNNVDRWIVTNALGYDTPT